MTSITEQLSATGKSHIENQLNLMDAVLRKSVEGVQQVVALNLHTARNVIDRNASTARELLAARDAREVLALATKPLPGIEGLLAYGRELFGIASRAQAELLQSATSQFRTLPGRPAAAPLQVAQQVAQQATEQVAQHIAEPVAQQVQAATDNVAAASAAIARSAGQASNEAGNQAGSEAGNEAGHEAGHEILHAATQATTQAAQEAAAVAREAARAGAEAAAPLLEEAQQAGEHVFSAAGDNIEQATASIVAAVADSAPVTLATETPDDENSAPRSPRGKPAAKPVVQALADIAEKPVLKSVPGKSQPRK